MPNTVQSFRAERRALRRGRLYSGRAHLAFTSAASLGVIAFALSRVHHAKPLEWLTVPLAFLIANAAEYFGHRGPMHRRKKGLSLVFERHTLEHHRFFTDQAMGFDSTADFHFVLFPPVMLLFFLGGIAGPLGAVCFWLFSANVGWLFVAIALGYFLTYEWLHFAYHLPDGHPLRRVGLIERLRRHHTAHHDPRWMGRVHFNITFPIFDWALGTLGQPAAVTAATGDPPPPA